MLCPTCGREMASRLGTHHYIESGLPNVWLKGVETHSCVCGEEMVGIPRLAQLNSRIGRDLLTKPFLLNGPEIRFLRKNMGVLAKELAELMAVAPETISRWENDKQAIEASNDRLLRLIYAGRKGLKYAETEASFSGIETRQLPGPDIVIAAGKLGRDGEDGPGCAA
ncbi:MAG: helix-turn-helix domain-containing protein [Deltaproteobacteria bacterium]|nr:helix-turn-helix domain-containing protein [Deltaproteobacteria bacterium]